MNIHQRHSVLARQEKGRVAFHPVRIDTANADEHAYVVFAEGQLVAVIVKLTDTAHGAFRGLWFVEAGFGPCATTAAIYFQTLRAVRDWIADKCLQPKSGSSLVQQPNRFRHGADRKDLGDSYGPR